MKLLEIGHHCLYKYKNNCEYKYELEGRGGCLNRQNETQDEYLNSCFVS